MGFEPTTLTMNECAVYIHTVEPHKVDGTYESGRLNKPLSIKVIAPYLYISVE